MLEYLMRHAGRVMSRTLITEYAWGYHFDPGTNIVDVVINHLRKKVDAKHQKRLITTVRGVGYMIKDERRDASRREPASKANGRVRCRHALVLTAATMALLLATLIVFGVALVGHARQRAPATRRRTRCRTADRCVLTIRDVQRQIRAARRQAADGTSIRRARTPVGASEHARSATCSIRMPGYFLVFDSAGSSCCTRRSACVDLSRGRSGRGARVRRCSSRRSARRAADARARRLVAICSWSRDTSTDHRRPNISRVVVGAADDARASCRRSCSSGRSSCSRRSSSSSRSSSRTRRRQRVPAGRPADQRGGGDHRRPQPAPPAAGRREQRRALAAGPHGERDARRASRARSPRCAASPPTRATSSRRRSPCCAPTSSARCIPDTNRAERMVALEEALQETARMSDLVDSLLTLARADEGRFDIYRQPVELEPLVREVYETAVILGEDAGLSLSLPHARERGGDGRSHAAAPAAAQPRDERDQVHAARRHAWSWRSCVGRTTRSRSSCATRGIGISASGSAARLRSILARRSRALARVGARRIRARARRSRSGSCKRTAARSPCSRGWGAEACSRWCSRQRRRCAGVAGVGLGCRSKCPESAA